MIQGNMRDNRRPGRGLDGRRPGPARGRGGFTLVEILIVVIILGILAGVVISQVGNATNDARTTVLLNDLRTVRGELERYRLRHENNYPADFEPQMLGKTQPDGTVDPAGPCGPYLPCNPTNPFNGLKTVQTEAGDSGVGDSSHGWHFNSITGQFQPDDPVHAGL